MMRFLFFLMLVAASRSVSMAEDGSAGIIAGSEVAAVSIPHSLQFDMRSRRGRDYRIRVAAPTGPQPPEGWPVVYHTDGENSFAVLVAAVEGQSRRNRPAVVVGIDHPETDPLIRRQRRTYDLTTTADDAWLQAEATPFANLRTGGCDEFREFLLEELKPEIQHRFSIDKNRETLFGHSFGGLFTLHSCLTHPSSFDAFVASSPSLWWNAGSLIAQERKFPQRFADTKRKPRLMVTVGEFELTPPSGSELKPPAFRAITEIGNAKQFSQRLISSGIDGLELKFVEIARAHHGSAELPAAAVGMQFALADEADGENSTTTAPQ